jgi:hypothetical protein
VDAHLELLPSGPSGLLSARPEPDLAARGYDEEEYVVSGTARAYLADDLPADGRFALRDGERADYATRVVVRRPVEATASGTLVAEWLNVSSGADAAPDWTFVAEEVLRSGHAWAGVSAQHVGVEGGGGLVALADLPPAPGLRRGDPDRYGALHHPGDAFAYDVFTQAARAVRDLLGAERVLAVGESQSAFCLTTYVNGVQPLTGLADGFLVHSRRAAPAPLGRAGAALSAADAAGLGPVRIRDDLDVPVLVVQTEGDLYDRIAYLPGRHPDSERVRVWEVAGAAHADHYVIGELESLLGLPVPVNRGQQWAVLRAALRHLDRWARGGAAPPAAPPLETTDDDCVRDEHGLARGGLRTPAVEVPTQVLSGRAWPGASLGAGLFGSTTPLAGVEDLYDSADAYLASYAAATDAAVAAGHVLAEDRDALLAEARPDLVDPTWNRGEA